MAEPPDSYLTLLGAAEVEIKVQRSRFIGLAQAADSEVAARKLIDETARRFHDARHVCFGYRLGFGDQSISRKSDDGEPSGTAGEPILTALARHTVTDALVIVVRYFGGVKLGTGGLGRAYGETAQEALSRAGTREVQLGREFQMEFPYRLEKTIAKLLDAHGGRMVDQQYTEQVAWRIWLAHSTWRDFSSRLTETTAGTVGLREVVPPGD